MSSPAVRLSEESTAAPVSEMTALLLITILSLLFAEFPAVKLVVAAKLVFAVIRRGLVAAIVPPPAICRANPFPSRSASANAPLLRTEKFPPISASRLFTVDDTDSDWSELRESLSAVKFNGPTRSSASIRRSPVTLKALPIVRSKPDDRMTTLSAKRSASEMFPSEVNCTT